MKAKSIFDQISPEHLGLLKRSYMLYGQIIPWFGRNSDQIHRNLGEILSTKYSSLRGKLIEYNPFEDKALHRFTDEFVEYLQKSVDK